MRLFIILLAFLTTNLFPPSVWATLQRSDHMHDGQIEYVVDARKEKLYHHVSEKLMNHPWLDGLLEENFHRLIIDKIMEKPQMTLPLANRIVQSYQAGQWDRTQFQQITNELVDNKWAEQLLEEELYFQLLKTEVTRRLMEEAQWNRDMMYQLVTDKLVGNAEFFPRMKDEGKQTYHLFSSEEKRSPVQLISPAEFITYNLENTTLNILESENHNNILANLPVYKQSHQGHKYQNHRVRPIKTLIQLAIIVILLYLIVEYVVSEYRDHVKWKEMWRRYNLKLIGEIHLPLP